MNAQNLFTRSFIYFLTVIVVGFLAVGLAAWMLLRTRIELNYAIADTPLPPVSGAPPAEGISYRNAEYGFSVTLPASWIGYRIVPGTREIRDVTSGEIVATAPTIVIRDPRWTTSTPRQDIPIDIYTPAEWEKITNEEYSVSAAPIPPSELGRNSRYVFALPARYNYAFPPGFEEVQKIIDGKPLAAFEPTGAAGQFCGGIAAIQCPPGFSCVLDGTFPDAGGRCVYSGE
jgi:hypothetical protein